MRLLLHRLGERIHRTRLADGGTYKVKGSRIGDFGAGWLVQPRQWLGVQWVGLFLGVPNHCPEPPGAPRGGAAAELGQCQGGHLDHAVALQAAAFRSASSARNASGLRP